MLFKFNLEPQSPTLSGDLLVLATCKIRVTFQRNPRARRDILRLNSQGQACVTIPRWGSAAEARRFAERNSDWLERQFQRLASAPRHAFEWRLGTEFFFRGDLVKLESPSDGTRGLVQFGSQTLRVPQSAGDLRPIVEHHLWRLACEELPPRVLAGARAHGLQFGRVAVRNQRSRWGSCSRRGTISLNWRLIQVPPFVCDYIIVHELMHLRQMNHSRRFWAEVERACPDYPVAERWLKDHSAVLLPQR